MGLNLLHSFLGLIKGSRWKKASKCKSLISKLKHRLLIQKNRRNAIIRQLHADIVQLLQHGKHQAALERVEQLYNDQHILSAYDQVDKFCDCVRSNLGDINSNSNLSDDVCEAVSSLIFAASRCGELPELQSIRILFRGLLGQNFERANVELLSANRVNSQIKLNLSKKSVAEDVMIQLLNEIATEDKHHVKPQIKVPAQTLSKELPEATLKYECRNLASYDHNGINAQPQASNFEEMLQRVGSKFCLKECKNMVTYWSNIPDITDKIDGSFTSRKANATEIQTLHHDEDIMNRVALTVSAKKSEGAIPCLDNKEKQSSRREDFRRGQEPNASETCMSFKRSIIMEVSDGNCNGMIKEAFKNTNVYSSQNAGNARVAPTVSASKAEGAVPCLDNKEKQSFRREDFRIGQEPNASETCMSFKRSNKTKVTDGNCNGMALKKTNVCSSQNAGDRRVASTVSASKAEGAVPCLDNKEMQSSRREDFRRGQEPIASETCMSFKRSNKRKVTDGNCNGKIKQALKNKNIYSSQNAGDIKARIYDEDKDKKISSPITHVHPKLPDYDDLVAKFTALKKEKMMRSSSIRALRNWFLEVHAGC